MLSNLLQADGRLFEALQALAVMGHFHHQYDLLKEGILLPFGDLLLALHHKRNKHSITIIELSRRCAVKIKCAVAIKYRFDFLFSACRYATVP
jgi:hypothetical protein